MYSHCLFCNSHLGSNRVLPTFPVGRRLAFDPARGRLWVVCPGCSRWNLSPLEERWEAIEQCEARYRGTVLRFSTDNIGLARLEEGLELVRIGRALRPEVAAWRYGGLLRRRYPAARLFGALTGLGTGAGEHGTDAERTQSSWPALSFETWTWRRSLFHRDRIVDTPRTEQGERTLIRIRHLADAELVRPEAGEPWRLRVRHETGELEMRGAPALRTAARILAAVNGRGVPADIIRLALRKLQDAGDPESYFTRVAALALRTSWGRRPDAPRRPPVLRVASEAERLALYLTSRSFWARGALGSEPRTPLLRLPLVDRLALEMAAHEDTERQAAAGELALLEAAWREAEEIAAIADRLPLSRLGLRRRIEAGPRALLPTPASA